MTRPSVAERLALKSARTPSGCVVFTAAVNNAGYGRLRVGYKTVGAHRVAWELAHGPIPEGMLVCHRCDNPPCVNVEHLFLGSPLDNMLDKVEKGRARGGRRGKLDFSTADEIRRRFTAGGVTKSELADEYGVCQSSIGNVVSGRTWS